MSCFSMHGRVSAVALVTILVLSSFFALSSSFPARAASLQDDDVVRYDDTLSSTVGLLESWTEIVQGSVTDDGGCSYAYEFSIPFDNPSPRVSQVTAVDPSSCEFELLIGIPSSRPVVSGPGYSSESDEQIAGRIDGRDCDSVPPSEDVPAFDEWILDCPSSASSIAEQSLLASADVFGSTSLGSAAALSHLNRKATGFLRYVDPLYITVSGALAAVRSNTTGSNIVGAACLHERKKYDTTGWRSSSSNERFNAWDCGYNSQFASSTVGAHHYNNDFPACLGNTVHVYYEDMYVVIGGENQVYNMGWTGWWKSGAPSCSFLLSAQQGFYPEEYWKWAD